MKLINGTWLEIHHFSEAEGKYFNPSTHQFSDEQWKEKVRELAALNMHYIVLIHIVSTSEQFITESFYSSNFYPKSTMIKANEPIKAILEEAEKQDIKVFLGAGRFGPGSHTYQNMISEEVREKTFQVMKEIYDKFGHYKSFYGWYYPDETGIDGHFEQFYMDYVNARTALSKKINPNLKTLIAPYGTKRIIFDEKYIEQLKILDVDFIAYQDEVGVKKATPKETYETFKKLKNAHDSANKSKLWADVEIFDFEDKVYKSALLPSNINRLTKQLNSVSDFVDNILVFQFQGMMNPEHSTAFCGHENSIKFYNDYLKLVQSSNS